MKNRKAVIAGYKSAITKRLNEKLSQRGLTSRQIAGYRAAATLKMQKLSIA